MRFFSLMRFKSSATLVGTTDVARVPGVPFASVLVRLSLIFSRSAATLAGKAEDGLSFVAVSFSLPP